MFLGVINYTFDKIMGEQVNEERAQKDLQAIGQSSATKEKQEVKEEPKKISAKSEKINRSRGKIGGAAHDDSGANILDNSVFNGVNATISKDLNDATNSQLLNIHEDDKPENHAEPVKTILINARKKKSFVGFCAITLANPYFSILRLTAIVLNSVTLAMIKYPETSREVAFQQHINVCLTFFFLIDNIVSIAGSGFKNYFREFYNIFDLVLSLISKLAGYQTSLKF